VNEPRLTAAPAATSTAATTGVAGVEDRSSREQTGANLGLDLHWYFTSFVEE
jgi:hypothetical protein